VAQQTGDDRGVRRRRSRANGGVFPFDRMYKIVDGREPIAGHSTADMPTWGSEYLVCAAGDYMCRTTQSCTSARGSWRWSSTSRLHVK
jgi:hypothetical protein